MAEPIINPVNTGSQAEAMAGAQALTFTATDRKVIAERSGGEINKTKSFKEIFADKPLSPKVENELTSVEPQMDVTEIEGKLKEHQKMLKNSPIISHRDKVIITNVSPDQAEIRGEEKSEDNETVPAAPADPKLHQETLAIARELNLDPTQLFAKLELEQKELHSLIIKIRDLHLKRLLCANRQDFAALSAEIEKETLASARPEARAWFQEQLKELKKSAAEYKLNLVKSLHSMHIDDSMESELQWLNQIIADCR